MGPGTTTWTCPSCGAANDEGVAAPSMAGASAGTAGRGRTLMIAGVLVAVAIVVGVFLLGGDGDDGGGEEDPAVAVATTELCNDIPRDLPFRTDALRRTGEAIASDANALREAGAEDLADQADALSELYLELSEATGAAEDTSALVGELITALDALPC